MISSARDTGTHTPGSDNVMCDKTYVCLPDLVIAFEELQRDVCQERATHDTASTMLRAARTEIGHRESIIPERHRSTSCSRTRARADQRAEQRESRQTTGLLDDLPSFW